MKSPVALAVLGLLAGACSGAGQDPLWKSASEDRSDGNQAGPEAAGGTGEPGPKATGATAGSSGQGGPQGAQEGNTGAGSGNGGGTGPSTGGTKREPALAVAASWQHACAIHPRGSVACWGDNTYGQLGGGTAEKLSRRAVAVAGIEEAVEVAAGMSQSCALRKNGAVVCWGGADGAPVSGGTRIPALSGARALVAGFGRMCALRDNGTLTCWPSLRTLYLADVPGVAGAIAVAATSIGMCALHAAGDVICWGKNTNGELGDGTTKDSDTPVRVKGLDDAVEIAANISMTCARRRSGAVVCWGGERVGASQPKPNLPNTIGNVNDAARLAVGAMHASVARTNGDLWSWGENYYGETGHEPMGHFGVPVPTTVHGVAGLAAGFGFTCGLLGSKVACWGHNDLGQLGAGVEADQSAMPLAVVGL